MQNQSDDKELFWTEESRELLLKTPIASVSRTTSTASDGQKGNFIVIDSRDWVEIVPVKKNNFIMVKQFRHGEKALSTEFPGGVVDDGESPAEAARRELMEETGCQAEKLIYLGKFNPNPAFMTNHVHVFLALDLKETGTQDLDEDEYLHCFEMSRDEVFKKMGSDEMPHALMASALMMFRQWEDNQAE